MRIGFATATVALAMLSACDSGGLAFTGKVSTVGQVAPNYRESDYTNASVNRDMWVIVMGAVPGADASEVRDKTLATMQRHAGIRTRFTATPQTPNRDYKTVIIYNGPNTLQADAICRNPTQQAAIPNPGLRLQAVFCRYDRSISEVNGRAQGDNSLNNANFDALIRQTMTDLYAASSENQKEEPAD